MFYRLSRLKTNVWSNHRNSGEGERKGKPRSFAGFEAEQWLKRYSRNRRDFARDKKGATLKTNIYEEYIEHMEKLKKKPIAKSTFLSTWKKECSNITIPKVSNCLNRYDYFKNSLIRFNFYSLQNFTGYLTNVSLLNIFQIKEFHFYFQNTRFSKCELNVL